MQELSETQEMFYTLIGPDGEIEWIDAETMFEAYLQGRELYGPGVVIRPTWYGEWDCGTEEAGSPCWHDKHGNHVKREEKSAETEVLEGHEIGEWEITFCYEEFTINVLGYSEGSDKDQAIRGAEEKIPDTLGDPLEITAKLTGSYPWSA